MEQPRDHVEEIMIGGDLVVLMVIGIVLTEQWLVHHYLLRHVFESSEGSLPDETADAEESAALGDVVDGKKTEVATSAA